MVTMRTETEASIPKSIPNPVVIEGTAKVSLYEQSREERIKENLQRMQNLGLLNLAQNLKSETRPVKRRYTRTNSAQNSTPPLQPSRRSSRLENVTPVIYTDGVNEKSKVSKRESVVIGEGARPEIYTEEHEKLLGNTERSWTCFVDGYDKDGKRIYDPFKGKTCHQCRQKTLGHRTHCSECEMVQGQFCGDCLFMRYGEHVLEALENPNWKCPVCRGICNCSLCRNHKGWVPTGPIYRRIAKLGYKSVAHYLIQTKRAQTDDDATPTQASAKRSLSFKEAKPLPEIADDDLSEEVVPKLHNGDSMKKEEDENLNSAKRSLSFVLPSSVDDQAPLVDVQVVGDLEPLKEDNQERSCDIGDDDLSRSEEKTGQDSILDARADSYLLPEENQTLRVVDVKVLSDETEIGSNLVNTRDIANDLARIQEKTGQDSSLDARGDCNLLREENQTLLVVDVKVLSDETGTSSASTRETRSKRKAAMEPNPDSIGARLRQRRRS
uniref:Cell division cycle-associated 7-like protein n=1 Tax=Noccaea caerulescens TaxID=107243 RepID=A0A1J3GE43_NOCCA